MTLKNGHDEPSWRGSGQTRGRSHGYVSSVPGLFVPGLFRMAVANAATLFCVPRDPKRLAEEIRKDLVCR